MWKKRRSKPIAQTHKLLNVLSVLKRMVRVLSFPLFFLLSNDGMMQPILFFTFSPGLNHHKRYQQPIRRTSCFDVCISTYEMNSITKRIISIEFGVRYKINGICDAFSVIFSLNIVAPAGCFFFSLPVYRNSRKIVHQDVHDILVCSEKHSIDFCFY